MRAKLLKRSQANVHSVESKELSQLEHRSICRRTFVTQLLIDGYRSVL